MKTLYLGQQVEENVILTSGFSTVGHLYTLIVFIQS